MENQRKISFRDYYQEQKVKHLELRERICHELEISKETFYLKLRKGDFTKLQQRIIAGIVGEGIELDFNIPAEA
jgi:hypothetical protein